MPELKFIMWASAFLVFYPYFGYIAALRAFSLVKRRDEPRTGGFEPRVTLLISAHNEEKTIKEKILNSLALDYPEDKLEIVLVSDGSKDRTLEIAGKYPDRITIRHYAERAGKTMCLNRAVPLAEGEIVVFSDANSCYEKNAVKLLVENFRDPSIGFVTGRTRYMTEDGGGFQESIGFYARIERLTKALESGTGSCVGADGAIFAIRKSLFKPLLASDINDLVIPLQVIRAGYSGVLEPRAYCEEGTSGSRKGEFNRQVRISARTLGAILRNRDLMNPLRHGLFSFKLVSHKLLRMLSPFFMLSLFAANILLVQEGPLYSALLLLQCAFYLSAVAGSVGSRPNPLSRVFAVSYAFAAVNAAILYAWLKFLKGESFVTWSPTRR